MLAYASGATCLGVMAANVDCNGMQKNICKLGSKVTRLENVAKEKAHNATNLGARYQYLINQIKMADHYFTQINGDLETIYSDTTKILSALADAQENLVQPADVYIFPQEIFQLDEEVDNYVVNIDEPSDTKTELFRLSWQTVGLAVNLAPYFGKALSFVYKGVTYPALSDFDMIFKSDDSLFGIKQATVFEIDPETSRAVRRASFSEVNHHARPKQAGMVERALGEYYTIANTKTMIAMRNIGSLTGAVFCAFTI